MVKVVIKDRDAWEKIANGANVLLRSYMEPYTTLRASGVEETVGTGSEKARTSSFAEPSLSWMCQDGAACRRREVEREP